MSKTRDLCVAGLGYSFKQLVWILFTSWFILNLSIDFFITPLCAFQIKLRIICAVNVPQMLLIPLSMYSGSVQQLKVFGKSLQTCCPRFQNEMFKFSQRCSCSGVTHLSIYTRKYCWLAQLLLKRQFLNFLLSLYLLWNQSF